MGQTSWILLDSEGRYRGGPVGPPESVPEGRRVSVRDTLRAPPYGFTMDLGSASGVALPFLGDGGYSGVEVTTIGPDLPDVVKLRARMLEKVGVKPIHSFIALPTGLKDSWRRLVWLIRWLQKGPIEQS